MWCNDVNIVEYTDKVRGIFYGGKNDSLRRMLAVQPPVKRAAIYCLVARSNGAFESYDNIDFAYSETGVTVADVFNHLAKHLSTQPSTNVYYLTVINADHPD